MQTLPTMDPDEGITVTFNFAKDLGPGDSVASCAVTVALDSGTDQSPAAILYGSAQISSPKVLQEIRGAKDGNTYWLRAKAIETVSGRPMVRQALLRVAFKPTP